MNTALNTDQVRAIVSKVWSEIVPACDYDEAISWAETGIDSLKTLRFALRLEEEIGQPVSFDNFTQQTTLADLIAALSSSGAANAPAADTAVPTIFMLPGVFGDEPKLAEFRASLKGRVQFHTLTLPDIDAPLMVSTNMQAMADRAVDEIRLYNPTGPIHLAGYSFGGYLAFETAHALTNRGLQVGLLVLLDAMTGNTLEMDETDGAPRYDAKRLRSKIINFAKLFDEGILEFFDRLALRIAMKTGALDRARKILMKPATPRTAEGSFNRRRVLLLHLRMRAMRGWRPQRLTTPVLLTTSDQYINGSTPEMWSSLCPDLTIEHVGGGHREIFQPDHVKLIKAALFRALDRYNQAAKPRKTPTASTAKRTKVVA